MKHLPLRYRIALATFVPLVVFGLLGLAVGAFAVRTVARDLVLQRQLAMARMAATGISGTLQTQVRQLEATARELAEHTADPERQQQILEERAGLLAGFNTVALMNTGGTVYAATPTVSPELGLDYGERDFFREVQATGKLYYSSVFTNQATGLPVSAIAVPILDSGGRRMAVLAGVYALDRPDWARDMNLVRALGGGTAYLVDRTGTVVYHPDVSRVGSTLLWDDELWRLFVTGGLGGTVYRPARADSEVVATFAPVPATDWGLVVEESWDTIIAPVLPFLAALVALGLLGLLAAIAALILSVTRVTRPLGTLVAEAQRVASGAPFRPVAIAGPPDLRTLLLVVNEMVARLQKQQEALRGYAAQVLGSQEEERLRISRELHDGTVQDLVALAQRIELSGDALDGDSAEARAHLLEAQRLAHKALVELRRMSNNLRPSILEDLGLVAALGLLARDLGDQLPRAGVHFETVGNEIRLPAEMELTVFRIAQEALTNVRKHASSATRVTVELIFEDAGVVLVIEDDGPGFPADEQGRLVQEGHLGLAGMSERARLFGGDLCVQSPAGGGTSLTLRLPAPAAPPHFSPSGPPVPSVPRSLPPGEDRLALEEPHGGYQYQDVQGN